MDISLKLDDAEVDRIADAVVAKLKSTATVTKTDAASKTEPKATKGTTKPKTEAAATAVSRPDVLAKLKEYAKTYSREAAQAKLETYGALLSNVADGDLPKLLADLSEAPAAVAEEPAAADEDDFGA